ncbi:DNA phosphorothioation system sulfurtransferase DndC [Helicobacter sp. 12S02634-8]|uniref:DNA phosphorothioation system sulfurtransferase DndC n=1 Tax=Helicobacter sp. 12S02634-8 TaxID=1476199 RepID=UPI001551ADD6|nr:DNA phosphorothioation system sulfurtransferase DndC [Helicobacter sp. 12S02634-8]
MRPPPHINSPLAPLSTASTSDIILTNTLETIKRKYLATKRIFIVAFSGGKDSTCVLQLIYTMLLGLQPTQRRPTFGIASDTLVEAPHIDKFLHRVIDTINTHAKLHQIPFEIISVAPKPQDQFWVNLIGKGYPSPTRVFRWCTDRLKIRPAKDAVAKIVHTYGSALLLLGTRKAESSNRKKSIEKHILNEDGYSQHQDFPNTLTYAPIMEWTTDDVWAYLIAHKPPWGKDHRELFALYSKASGDECQFITDLRQSSCGGSRFGCWVCTVVSEDKSMQGFIDSGESELWPLNAFRNFIKNLREDPNARADYKRDGRAVYKIEQKGPFTSKARIMIFRELLLAEREFKTSGGGELISDGQILEIQKAWDRDFDLNHTAIKIAKEFDRMQEIEDREYTSNGNRELLEQALSELEGKYQSTGLSIDILESLIGTSAQSSYNLGKDADREINEALKKIVEDQSAQHNKGV